MAAVLKKRALAEYNKSFQASIYTKYNPLRILIVINRSATITSPKIYRIVLLQRSCIWQKNLSSVVRRLRLLVCWRNASLVTRHPSFYCASPTASSFKSLTLKRLLKSSQNTSNLKKNPL